MFLDFKIDTDMYGSSYRVGGYDVDYDSFKQLLWIEISREGGLATGYEIVAGVQAKRAERYGLDLRKFGKSKNKQAQYKQVYKAYNDAFELKKKMYAFASVHRANEEKLNVVYEQLLAGERKNPRTVIRG